MNDTGPIPLRSSTANHPPSKYWCSTTSAYGDLRYLCPGFHANDMAAHFHSSTPVNLHLAVSSYYNVLNPNQADKALSVAHIVEGATIWEGPKIRSAYAATHKSIVLLMQSYWIMYGVCPLLLIT